MAKRVVFTETGEFRLPRLGEWFIGNRAQPCIASHDFAMTKWRILIRTEENVSFQQTRERQMKRIMFTETGEVRPPRKGEWYDCGVGGYLEATMNIAGAHPVFTRTEETIPDPPKPRKVVWVPNEDDDKSVHCLAFTKDGFTFCSVEVPTKREIPEYGPTTPPYLGAGAFDRTPDTIRAFHIGVQYLADKLGIKME